MLQGDYCQGGEGEHCAEVLPSGEWNDNGCSSLKQCVCFDSGSNAYQLTSDSYSWDQCASACSSNQSEFACGSDNAWHSDSDSCGEDVSGDNDNESGLADLLYDSALGYWKETWKFAKALWNHVF